MAKKFLTALVLLLLLASTSFGQAKLMSREKEARLRSLLPNFSNDEYQKILIEDPTTIFYTIDEMPAAYQHSMSGGSPTTFHWAGYNISGDPSDSGKPHGFGGNANVDFPWRFDTPGGTHRCRNVETFKAMWLPKQSNGRPYPVAVYRQRLPTFVNGSSANGYGWVYPTGTKFFEVLAMTGPGGYTYVFEVRVREKTKETWEIALLRPFGSSDELAAAIKELAPRWAEEPTHLATVRDLEQPEKLLTQGVMVDRHRTRHAFRVRAGVDPIGPISNELVAKLLTQTAFRNVVGEEWRVDKNNRVAAYAPTTSAPFHIVPANYDATYIGTDTVSCKRCHDSVLHNTNFFDAPRGWYGFVRGSDGIMSFHPISPSSVSRNGAEIGVSLRPALTQSGVVENYSPNRHPADMYHKVKGFQ